MRLAFLAPMLLVAGCATAPPAESRPPTVLIPSFWPLPPGEMFGRCPTCGQPVPLIAPPSPTSPPVLDADEAQSRASVGGRYRVLLRKIEVPGDWLSYGAFCDWGFWSGTSYAGIEDLPPGHWVYVHPNWYVWQEPDGSAALRRTVPRARVHS